MTERVDCAVIGAGVVGLAIGRALSREGRDVLILEAENAIGTQTSARNNEVIHAGFLYPPGSLKGRLCRVGSDALYEFCDSHGVAYCRIGKLVIATSDAECASLRTFWSYGKASSVRDLEWLDGRQAASFEPQLQCVAAIHSRSTGIVDSHALMLALAGDAEDAGASIARNTKVVRLRPAPQGIRVTTKSETGTEYEIEAGLVINAAGLGAHELVSGFAASCGFPEIHFAKGNFFSFAGQSPFTRLIVPVGENLSAGAAFTVDIGGQGKFGPDLEWTDTVDYAVDARRAEQVAEAVSRLYPSMSSRELVPSFSGIRPRVSRSNAGDWHITGPADHGLAGLINLLGIDTPGLTACLGIADHVVTMARSVWEDRHASLAYR